MPTDAPKHSLTTTSARSGADLPPVSVLSYTRSTKPGALRGWCSVHIPKMRCKLHNVAVFSSSAGEWAAPPSRESGKDADGRPRWMAQLEWDSRIIAEAFSRAVIDGLDRYEPGWRG